MLCFIIVCYFIIICIMFYYILSHYTITRKWRLVDVPLVGECLAKVLYNKERVSTSSVRSRYKGGGGQNDNLPVVCFFNDHLLNICSVL